MATGWAPASSASGSVHEGQREASGGLNSPALARGPSRTWGREPQRGRAGVVVLGRTGSPRWAADGPTGGRQSTPNREKRSVWLSFGWMIPVPRLPGRPLPALCCVLLTVSVPNVRDGRPSGSSVGSGVGPGGGRRRGRPLERRLGGGTDTPGGASKRNGDSGRWTLTCYLLGARTECACADGRQGSEGNYGSHGHVHCCAGDGPVWEGAAGGPGAVRGEGALVSGSESRTLLLLLPFAVVSGVLFCFCSFWQGLKG